MPTSSSRSSSSGSAASRASRRSTSPPPTARRGPFVDYIPRTFTITFADNDDAPKFLFVEVLNDNADLGNRTVNLILSNPARGGHAGRPVAVGADDHRRRRAPAVPADGDVQCRGVRRRRDGRHRHDHRHPQRGRRAGAGQLRHQRRHRHGRGQVSPHLGRPDLQPRRDPPDLHHPDPGQHRAGRQPHGQRDPEQPLDQRQHRDPQHGGADDHRRRDPADLRPVRDVRRRDRPPSPRRPAPPRSSSPAPISPTR